MAITASELINIRGSVIGIVPCVRCGTPHRDFVNSKNADVVRNMLNRSRFRGTVYGLFIRSDRVCSAQVGTRRYREFEADPRCRLVGTYDDRTTFAQVLSDVESAVDA